ncbi:MAG: MFS transporter, partial [Thermobifida fusca]|nr:MFS transporter [Thermobifida fusca]
MSISLPAYVPGWTSGEAVGAGGAVGALVGGQLADRWGRRATLLTAQLSTAATLLLVGVSSHPGMILGSCLLLGTVQSMARPAYAAMMIDVVPESARLRAFTLQHWANNLAFSLAALLGGLLAALHYLIIFVVNAGATLLAAAVIFGKTVETRPAAPTRGTRGTPTSRHSP